MLEPLEEETFFIYKQTDKSSNYSQVGLLAALDIDDCKSGKIKRHEKTTKDVDAICSEKIKNYRVSFNVSLVINKLTSLVLLCRSGDDYVSK